MKKQTQTNPISNPTTVFLRKESLGLLITQEIALLCEVLATQHEPRPREPTVRSQWHSFRQSLLGALTLNAGMVKLLKGR